MKTSHFVIAMLSLAYLFSLFVLPEQGSDAFRLGRATGLSLGVLAIGIALGTIFWLPFRLIKGAKSTPDFKLFSLSATILTILFLLVGVVGPRIVGS
jgi:hypothetical protein